jgi:peptidoglycan/LPS O-acetylase OafA/YrhL
MSVVGDRSGMATSGPFASPRTSSVHPRNGQIAFVHLLRGVAPILVLWAHLGGWWLAVADVRWEPYRLWFEWAVKPLALFQEGGHLGVVLFFFISGYIITFVSGRETVRAYAIRRFFRLVPVLAIALVVTALATLILSTALGLKPLGVQSIAPRDLALNFLQLCWPLGTPYTLSVTWTLFVEIVFYAMTAATMTLGRRAPAAATWAQLALVALVTVPFALGVPSGPVYLQALLYLPLLVVGRIIYLLHAGQISAKAGSALMAAAWSGFGALYVVIHGNLLWTFAQPPFWTYLQAGVLVGTAMAFVRTTPRILSFLADISYSLYMLHLPIGSVLLFGMKAWNIDVTIAYLITFAVVIAVAHACHRYVEVPAQALGRRLSGS